MALISIIIPTRNRAAYLADTLSSLDDTSGTTSAEILVVDNGSTDNTRDVVSRFSQKSSFPVRYEYEATPGLHVGRNLGAQLAHGEILAYLDDDVFVSPTWLSGIQDAFAQYPDLALLGGPCIPHWESQPPQWILDLKSSTSDGGWLLSQLSLLDLKYNKPAPCSPWHIFGCNFILRKDILFKAGGFHPDGMPEDLLRYRGDGESYISQYVIDNNLSAVYHPDCKVEHRVSEKRLTKEYIDHIAVRIIYSQAYTLCRKTGFAPERHARMCFRLAKDMLKNFARLLLGKAHAGISFRSSLLLFKLCAAYAFSPQLRSWICQPSYFKEDPCPYRRRQ